MNGVRAGLLCGTIMLLAGCSAPYIAVEAYQDDSEIWFRNANASLFVSDCVDAVEVTDAVTGELVWDASAEGAACLAHLPFRYGSSEAELDADKLVTAQELQPGREYSVFVYITGGAGDGSFRIEPDGTVTNLD
jgi:hypothetical protein